jgi:hypothetical protein
MTITGWLQKWRHGFVAAQDFAASPSATLTTDCTCDEMGLRCFEVKGVPQGRLLKLAFNSGRAGGYTLSIFPGGSLDEVIEADKEGTSEYTLSASEANGTLIAVTRRPGASGSSPASLTLSLLKGDESQQGLLDIVVCIDKSGSMMDDIKAVQAGCDAILAALTDLAKTQNISLQVGLVTYTRHDEPNWLQANLLTTDVNAIRGYIRGIDITNPYIGKGGNEDTYGAVMYAMDQKVGGLQTHMGWRSHAAKIIIPIGDEPQDDPDWEGCALDDVARVARQLDPVHMYPLLLPKMGSSFLDPAVRGMERLAGATGGQVIRVSGAKELPAAVVRAVKLAIRQHRDEVWRKTHPPYLLYGAIGAILAVILLSVVILIVRAARAPAATEPGRQ